MYLTKIEMDRRSPSVQQALRDCEDMHRNVQRFFSNSRQKSGVLYTVHSTDGKLDLYVLSENVPEAASSTNGMKIVASRDMYEFEKSFEKGKVFAFRLAAHPSKKKHIENVKNSKRKFIRDSEQQYQWIEKKGKNGGFDLLSVHIEKGGTMYSKKKERMLLPFVEYSGFLRINDAQQFLDCWKKGIGPEKAYGLGMLLLK